MPRHISLIVLALSLAVAAAVLLVPGPETTSPSDSISARAGPHPSSGDYGSTDVENSHTDGIHRERITEDVSRKQPATYRFRILDDHTGVGVPGARIECYPYPSGKPFPDVLTDESGHATIRAVAPMEFRVTCPGYANRYFGIGPQVAKDRGHELQITQLGSLHVATFHASGDAMHTGHVALASLEPGAIEYFAPIQAPNVATFDELDPGYYLVSIVWQSSPTVWREEIVEVSPGRQTEVELTGMPKGPGFKSQIMLNGEPWASSRVTLRGRGIRAELISDDEAFVESNLLPPGDYLAETALRNGMPLSNWVHASTDRIRFQTARLAVKTIAPDGNPVHGAKLISLVPTGFECATRWQSGILFTHEIAAFELLPSGWYTVLVLPGPDDAPSVFQDRTIVPQVIHLTEGDDIELSVVLQEACTAEIAFPEGSTAREAWVFVGDDLITHASARDLPDGEAVLKLRGLPPGRARFRTRWNQSDHAATQTATNDVTLTPLGVARIRPNGHDAPSQRILARAFNVNGRPRMDGHLVFPEAQPLTKQRRPRSTALCELPSFQREVSALSGEVHALYRTIDGRILRAVIPVPSTAQGPEGIVQVDLTFPD